MTSRNAQHARGVLSILAGLSMWSLSVAIPAGAAAADPWPASVRAAYEISFNGFSVGAFDKYQHSAVISLSNRELL